MRLTVSVKANKAVSAYYQICTYKRYAPNNTKIWYVIGSEKRDHFNPNFIFNTDIIVAMNYFGMNICPSSCYTCKEF